LPFQPGGQFFPFSPSVDRLQRLPELGPHYSAGDSCLARLTAPLEDVRDAAGQDTADDDADQPDRSLGHVIR
jgi:hypothetical protein